MLRMDVIFTVLIIGLVAVVIPGGLTVWNVYNLFSKKPKREVLVSWLTILIGGIFYLLLFDLLFETAGDWYQAIYVVQVHYAISTQYRLGIILPMFVGAVGLTILIIS